jgi:hypothetical protein
MIAYGPELSYRYSAGGASSQVQPYENAVFVRKIPDDLLHRRREMANQRWEGHNLIASRQLRLFQQID